MVDMHDKDYKIDYGLLDEKRDVAFYYRAFGKMQRHTNLWGVRCKKK